MYLENSTESFTSLHNYLEYMREAINQYIIRNSHGTIISYEEWLRVQEQEEPNQEYLTENIENV